MVGSHGSGRFSGCQNGGCCQRSCKKGQCPVRPVGPARSKRAQSECGHYARHFLRFLPVPVFFTATCLAFCCQKTRCPDRIQRTGIPGFPFPAGFRQIHRHQRSVMCERARQVRMYAFSQKACAIYLFRPGCFQLYSSISIKFFISK
jgi:hypothetical protein